MTTSNQENFEINEESSLHKYKTEHPNLVYDIGLDPYEGWLYSHLKRIAGDKGTCFKSITNLCEITKMGETKLKDTKKSLAQKGLIKITKRFHPNGDSDTDLIIIIDIWEANFRKYLEVAKKPTGGGSPNEPGVGRQTSTKKNPYKESLKESNKEKNASNDADAKASQKKKYEIRLSEEEEEMLLKIMDSCELKYWKEQVLTHLMSIGRPNKYKSHYAVIRNWFNADKKKKEMYIKKDPIKRESKMPEYRNRVYKHSVFWVNIAKGVKNKEKEWIDMYNSCENYEKEEINKLME